MTKEESEKIERIQRLVNDRGITVNAFSKLVDITQSNLSRKLRGALPITELDLFKIANALKVEMDWLKDGVGEPYQEEGKSMLNAELEGKATSARPLVSMEKTRNRKPFYDIDFALGFQEYFNDSNEAPSCYVEMPGFDTVDFWCRASGDSMMPCIKNGDAIGLKEIDAWFDFIPMNEVYAIVTMNNLRTVKVIRKGHDETCFTLHSYNSEYEDQEIQKSSILKVYKVIGVAKAL